MTARDESGATILFSDPRSRNKTTDCGFAKLVSLIVPRSRNLGMHVVSDVIISMQWLRLSPGTDAQGDTRMNIGFRHRLLSLVSPPEPTSRGKKVVTHSLVQRVHQHLSRIGRTQGNQAGGASRLLWKCDISKRHLCYYSSRAVTDRGRNCHPIVDPHQVAICIHCMPDLHHRPKQAP